MDQTAVLQLLDRENLTDVVRRALGRHTLDLTSWQLSPFGQRSAGFSTGGLFRVSGTADDQGTAKTWSVVLKILQPASSEPANHQNVSLSHYAYWKREALLYQSGLFAELTEGLAAPRCYGVSEPPGAGVWLWLEEITDEYAARWPLDRYRLAARHFGRLNGSYLTHRALPTAPWLSRGHDRCFVADFTPMITPVLEAFQQDGIWQHPALRRAFPVPNLDRFLSLWDDRARFLNALEYLPQTFCHYDAMRPNLFTRRGVNGQEQTVAIDWAHSGIAGIGVELAEMVVGSLLFLHVASHDAAQLDRQAFTGYQEGMHEVGWQGDPKLMRFGYLTSALLRLGPLGLLFLHGALSGNSVAQTEAFWGRPIAELVEHWADVVAFILNLVDEVRELLNRLEQDGVLE